MIKVSVKLKYALLYMYYINKHMFIVDYLHYMLEFIILINGNLQCNIWFDFWLSKKERLCAMFQIKERQLGRTNKMSYFFKDFILSITE